ncbi:MAG: energy transducer TonB [Marinoscillum sp.]
MSRTEILEYLIKNRNHSICGHLKPSQLDYSREEFLIVIRKLSTQHNKSSNLAFLILAVASLAVSGCTFDEPAIIKSEQIALTEIGQDTSASHSVINDEITLTGIVFTETAFDSPLEERYISEVMPEFEGGVGSLYSFIHTNLKYPKWEYDNHIQGRVFVSIVINPDGSVSDPQILKSVTGSRNFDAEVLRVIALMPKWKPGTQDGIPVKVKSVLPFKFEL